MSPAGATDVEVLARDDETLGAVLAALEPAIGAPAICAYDGATPLQDDLPLTDPRLRHGAVLGVGRPLPQQPGRAGIGALELHVVGGVNAGQTAALAAGEHMLGRGPGSVVPLDDPDVSRRHAVIRVGRGAVEVADLGSSNGSRLDDGELTGSQPWRPAARLTVGATTLELAGPGGVPAGTEPAAAGRTALRPPARTTTARTTVEVTLPGLPTAPPPRRLAWVAVALPAVGGIALAVALSAPTFLFFALLSPLVAVASCWSDRRSGRRSHRRDLAESEERMRVAEEQLSAAVRAELHAAHRRLPDLAALATAARRRTSLLWTRGPDDPDALTIRVGTGPGTTAVVRHHPDGRRVPEPADDLPVEVDLRSGGLAVVGPRVRCLGALRAAIAQLTALHPPDALELVLLTSAARLPDWGWARWLPHVRVDGVLLLEGAGSGSSDELATRSLLAMVERRRAASRAAPGRAWAGPWTGVVVDAPLSAAVAAALARVADAGITVLTHGETPERVPVPLETTLRVTGELGTRARLHAAHGPAWERVALDLLPLDVAADLARALAPLTPATSRSALPSDVRLLDIASPEAEPADEGVPVTWPRGRRSLEVALGVGSDGVERLDLCRHGPHALIAGTTGAGKSELLQTLIAGLALGHPPDRCSFLLVDYKGGAAFAEAALLPHTVGLLTDLDEATTARALRSLDAEITRREMLLAKHAVADISDLPDEMSLARLVIAVDEFATLAEELPGFVPGLVGVAQRGRSLGIHLVLATQRPAGVVSADIRANCTLRICLRTTDEADSRDVLGGPEAAHLALEVPGRAFVRTGAGAARLLQVARVSQASPGPDDGPVVAPWPWPLRSSAPSPARGGDTDLARVVRALRARADRLSLPVPHRPWHAPLPALVSLADAEAVTRPAGRPATELLLGLVDRPEQQDQRPLALDLDEGGAWLAVGGPRSGRTSLLRSVLRQAVTGLAADRLHVHVVDLGGGALASEATPLPQVGTAIGTEDALRAVRLVHRLAEEVTRRRSHRTSIDPRLLLLVDGVEALCSLLDDADPSRGSGELLRLIRDGGAAGLTCVLTADRAVPGGRLAGLARQRLVLPLPDRADYAVAGVPMTAVPSERPPGRALVGENAAECQLVLPPPFTAARQVPDRSRREAPVPLSIPELEPDPVVDGRVDDGARSVLRVAVGPGGDEGDLRFCDLLRTGGLLVIGPPGSGRTATLDAVVGDLARVGVPVLHLATAPRPTGTQPPGVTSGELDDPAAVMRWLAARPDEPCVVCVDDLGPAGSAPALGALSQLGTATGVALLATTTSADASTWFQGPVAALRRARTGLLLRPGPGDADALGIRLPRTPLPSRPGMGWLVQAGVPERVQVARHRVRPRAAQSNSSTGPISCVAYQASS